MQVLLALASGLISSIVALVLKEKLSKKRKIKMFNIKFDILIYDIEEFLGYIENIIINRVYDEKYYVNDIDYKEILIEYQEIYKDISLTDNLLQFYKIRHKIESEIIKYLKQDLNRVGYIGYLKSITDMYKELEDIFIKNDLEEQIKKWQKNNKLLNNKFKFKHLEDLYKEREQILLYRLKELDEIYKILVDESGINLLEGNYKSNSPEGIAYSKIKNYYHSLIAEKQYINIYERSKLGITSKQEALYYFEGILTEKYDIEAELDLL